jgi:hypothetical protein
MFFLNHSAICTEGCTYGDCKVPATCDCYAGWEGPTCKSPACLPKCKNGQCIRTMSYNASRMVFTHECQCQTGWNGTDCGSRKEASNIIYSHTLQPSVVKDVWEAHAVSPTRAIALRTGRAMFATRVTRAGLEASVQLVCLVHSIIRSPLIAICAAGCEAGTCARPGDCVCNRGFHGPLCTSTHIVSVANSGIGKCEFADAASECILGWLVSPFYVF